MPKSQNTHAQDKTRGRETDEKRLQTELKKGRKAARLPQSSFEGNEGGKTLPPNRNSWHNKPEKETLPAPIISPPQSEKKKDVPPTWDVRKNRGKKAKKRPQRVDKCGKSPRKKRKFTNRSIEKGPRSGM